MRLPPPLWALLALASILAADHWLPATSLPWATLFIQAGLGGGLVALGLGMDLLAIAGFVQVGTTITPWSIHRTSALVTRGLNSISRNPMYLGMALWLTGVGLWLGSLITPLAVAGFVAILNATQIAAEERMLEEKFGQDYRDYKQRVRRWL